MSLFYSLKLFELFFSILHENLNLMPVILYENYTRTYYAPLYSISGLFCFIVLLIVSTFPFFASFYSGYFWTNTYTYYEAPRVNFNNEYIITVLEDGVSKFYSSHSFMNLLYPNTLKAPLLQVTPFDVNGNSYNYKYNILFKFNSNPSKVQNIRLILFWDYILKDIHKFKTQTITYINLDFSYAAAHITTTGTIKLKQKGPINERTVLDASLNTGIFKNSTMPQNINLILEYFYNLNITTYYDYQKVVMPFVSTTDTTLDMTFIVPSYQPVTALSTIPMIFKAAWPRYFCLFIPTAIIAYISLSFIFKYRIAEAVIYDNLPEELKEKRSS